VSRNVTLVQLMLNVYYFFLNLLPPYLRTVSQIDQRFSIQTRSDLLNRVVAEN
jgi:hypothetical protein